MILWQLFVTFLLIGLVSFGGGYAMIVPISHQVILHRWMTEQQFTEVIALAGMAPGPISTNSAIFVGFKVGGLAGALAATAGMVLPSLVLMMLAASLFYKWHDNRFFQAALYGLRAAVIGLIFYGAIHFGMEIGLFAFDISRDWVISLLIFAAALVALLRKVHPAIVILASGVAGLVSFG